MSRAAEVCPLCDSTNTTPLENTGELLYHACIECRLVYLAPEHLLSPEEELKRYRLHTNSPDETGYRNFLLRFFTPFSLLLPPGAQGLEFGCGPGPVLAGMFREAGFGIRLYDPFFFPDTTALVQRYDFISATEVVEHFHRPRYSWDLLFSLLQPGGYLGIMTKCLTGETDFPTWYYRREETHVAFYRAETFSWIAERWGARLSVLDRSGDVIAFQMT